MNKQIKEIEKAYKAGHRNHIKDEGSIEEYWQSYKSSQVFSKPPTSGVTDEEIEKLLDSISCCTITEDADLDNTDNLYYNHKDLKKALKQFLIHNHSPQPTEAKVEEDRVFIVDTLYEYEQFGQLRDTTIEKMKKYITPNPK